MRNKKHQTFSLSSDVAAKGPANGKEKWHPYARF
jgi:hypothetical protein